MLKSTLLFIIVIVSTACSTLNKKLKDETKTISTLMQEQENCWNKGDLDCFMQHYWKSDSLTFIGSSGVNYGWQTTLNNYKKSYKNKSEMGILSFHNIAIKQLANNYIHVIGKWYLKRSAPLEDIQGNYTLVWKKINNDWLIISDHSS